MKVLIIGNGSIAIRHANLLHKSGKKVYIYMHRPELSLPSFAKSQRDLREVKDFSAGFICTPTTTHIDYAEKLLSQGLSLFIEKPLSDEINTRVRRLLRVAKSQKIFCMVGFNMRFLPIIKIITQLLDQQKLGNILAADLYVGHNLSDWRPTQKYEETYSAVFKQGGGAALDLIHEIDLAYSWFEINSPIIVSHKLGRLKTNTEDYVHITTTKPPAVTITLDTLNKVKTRQYRIIGSLGSVYCDIYRRYTTLTTLTGSQIEYHSPNEFDTQISFKQEHDYFFKMIENNGYKLMTERFWGIDALKLCVKARKYVQEL